MIERLVAFLKGRGERARLAVEAKRWTTNDAFNVALMKAREETVRQWAAARTPGAREHYWHAYSCLESFPIFLQGLIDNELIDKHRES